MPSMSARPNSPSSTPNRPQNKTPSPSFPSRSSSERSKPANQFPIANFPSASVSSSSTTTQPLPKKKAIKIISPPPAPAAIGPLLKFPLSPALVPATSSTNPPPTSNSQTKLPI